MAGSPLQTEEELLLIKEALILPIMIDELEQGMQYMKQHYMKMAELYIDSLHHVQSIALSRMYTLKKELRNHQLKIIETEQDEYFLKASYLCRGYQHQIVLLWEIVYANIELRLAAAFHITLQ